MPSSVRLPQRVAELRGDWDQSSFLDGYFAAWDETSGKFRGRRFISTSDLPEGVNLYFTPGRFDFLFAGKSTTDLPEGVNLYFTSARASSAAPVQSVFGRPGVIVAQPGDYSVSQVTGAAPLDSPSLTGIPTAPTAPVDTGTAQVASTAFVLGQAGSATPLAAGSAGAGPGTGSQYSRQNHVHPLPVYATAGAGALLIDQGVGVSPAFKGLSGDASITSGGVLTIADLVITDAKVAAVNKDGVAAVASMRTLGVGAQQACAGNDFRLSDARSPVGVAGGGLSGAYPNPMIAAGAVPLSAIVDVPSGVFLGRSSVGVGSPEVMSIAAAKGLLSISGTNTGDQTITLTGDVVGSGTGSFVTSLANSGVAAGVYGDSGHVAVVTVNVSGRLTNVTTAAIGGASWARLWMGF